MKILVKSTAFILVCIMLLSSLVACAAQVSSSDDEPEDKKESAEEKDDEENEEEDEENEEEDEESSEEDEESSDEEDEDTFSESEESEESEEESTETETETETESESETETETEEESSTTTPDPDFPNKSFPILQNKQYKIKLIIPDSASAAEKLVASELKTALKSKTGVSISFETDYVANNSNYDENAYEILVGNTARKESVATYRNLSYNAYGIKIIGNKIIFFFTTEAEGSQLVTQFKNKIQSNNNGQFWVSSTYSMSAVAIPELNNIPAYPNGTITTVNCGDDTKMVVSTNTSLDKFNEYCNTLKSKGYEEYSKRENIDGNYFRIYTKNNTAINAYFSTGRKQARIIVGPLKDIPSKQKDTTPETIKPSLTMIGPSESTGNGLGLVYQLANGKFLIIDGGHRLSDRIYKELRELQPKGGKLIIAGWFISHPHNDHQDSIENFIELHAHEVTIENIYFNYAQAEYYNNLTSKDHQGEDQKEGARVTRLRELLKKKLSLDTKIVKPHTGQVYTFGSASVEIISTVEDFLPTTLAHVNESSMVIRVTVAGQTTMVLADASTGMKERIMKMYTSHLKSDIVTLAHHGVWDCTPKLYDLIKGKTLLWPSNTESARQYYGKSETSEARKAIVAALNNATDVFLAKGTDTKLMLPYTPVGNKNAFMNETLK